MRNGTLGLARGNSKSASPKFAGEDRERQASEAPAGCEGDKLPVWDETGVPTKCITRPQLPTSILPGPSPRLGQFPMLTPGFSPDAKSHASPLPVLSILQREVRALE